MPNFEYTQEEEKAAELNYYSKYSNSRPDDRKQILPDLLLQIIILVLSLTGLVLLFLALKDGCCETVETALECREWFGADCGPIQFLEDCPSERVPCTPMWVKLAVGLAFILIGVISGSVMAFRGRCTLSEQRERESHKSKQRG